MSLQKIGKYTEIFESSRKLQKPTKYDHKRTALIQCIAIAGLIEAGAPYEADNGEIIIDTGMDFKSVFINDVYPYLSPEGQMKVMVENAKMVELPAPPPSEQLPLQENATEETQTDIPEFTSAAVKKEEKRKDPIKMMDGLENYESDQPVPDEDGFGSPEERTAYFENQKWNSVESASVAPEQPAVTPEPSVTPESPIVPVPDVPVPNVPESVMPAPETAAPIVNPEPSYNSYNNIGTEVNQTDPAYVDEAPVNTPPVENSSTVYPDVVALNKYDITYERCNLEVTKSDGTVLRFSVHSAPLTENYDGMIISRLKGLGNNNNYIHTECGSELAFVINDTVIRAKQGNGVGNTFGCMFWSDDPTVMINKINVEVGGNQGNLVIYDDDLELRIYPFHNVRNKETGRMEFGNNSKGEAAFLYYVKNKDQIIASSGIEREPKFTYENVDFLIKAKWNDDDIFLTAEDI